VPKIITVDPKQVHTKPVMVGNGRLKEIEPIARGRAQNGTGASQARTLYIGQSRWEKLPGGKIARDRQVTVSVLGSDPVKIQARFSKPLMPCHPARARQLKKKGAKSRWFKGLYAIQVSRSEGVLQSVACGIDPGGKREAFTVQSRSHTYLNVLSDAINHVSERVVTRQQLRRNRRRRKTPCRAPRWNRSHNNWIAPSIRSRWEAKLRIINFLRKLYPITSYVIEDVAARKRPGQRRWNKSFSNLELGKTEYYRKISELGTLKLIKGYDTAGRREEMGLKKGQDKLSENFDSHNVDSWVLASFNTGKESIDNKNVFRMVSHIFFRRMLHKGSGIKKVRYGGTLSMGFKKGSVVKHPQYGLLYVDGSSKGGINLCNLSTGGFERHYDNPAEYTFLYYSGWRTNWVNNVKVNRKKSFVGGHSLRDPNIREKGCQTKEALYGDRGFTNRPKSVQTCLAVYGVDNVGKVPEVKEKAVNTLMEKYGKIFNWDRPDTFTKEQLIELYINQGLTFKEIGAKFNLNASTVGMWVNRHGIPIKNWRYKREFSGERQQLLQKSYSESDLLEAQHKLIDMSKERGVSRNNYKDGILGVPTHVLEKKYGTWNNFIGACGLEPGYTSKEPSDHVKDYFQACVSKNKILSFYEYEKVTGNPCTRLKRLFNKGKPYNSLIEDLYKVALFPDQWPEFLFKFK